LQFVTMPMHPKVVVTAISIFFEWPIENLDKFLRSQFWMDLFEKLR